MKEKDSAPKLDEETLKRLEIMGEAAKIMDEKDKEAADGNERAADQSH